MHDKVLNSFSSDVESTKNRDHNCDPCKRIATQSPNSGEATLFYSTKNEHAKTDSVKDTETEGTSEKSSQPDPVLETTECKLRIE